MNETDTEVSNAELLARIERLEALLTPRMEFLEELETAIKSNPMAQTMMGM